MAEKDASLIAGLDAQARLIAAEFTAAGCREVAPDIVQPADIFLDRLRENMRQRAYVFTDLAGEELCLRPDLTVPVSRLYLERHPDAKEQARYCYNGPAFRFQPLGPSATHPREFRQAGIDNINHHAADLDIAVSIKIDLAIAGINDCAICHCYIAIMSS